jgi:DMSO/TMAO reductase YedYZ heme-binding membrane subunit
MKHKSTFPRLIALALCAITILMPLAIWWQSIGGLQAYLQHSVPPGQIAYVFSKLFALLAIVLCWFQVMAALAKRDTPVLRGFPLLGTRTHVALGVATFVVVSIHLGLFVLASTQRTQHLALNLLVPSFDEGFFRTMVSLGAIAFWLLLVAVVAGRQRLARRRGWVWMHRVVFIALALGFAHGMMIGSESRYGAMKYVYAFVGLSIGAALASQLYQRLRMRRGYSGVLVGAARSENE